MTKIGIFGGSFNPVHVGHVALARQLRRLAALDEVWLMVSPQNPLKPADGLLDDQLRYQLVRLALHGEQGLRASAYELALPKPSYTWNTMEHLSEDYPDAEFSLLIGADNWALFPRWYRAADLVDRYRIVVYPRAGSSIDRESLPARVTLVDTPLLDVSSTDIRQRQRARQPIDHLVPPAILPLVRKFY